MIKEKSKLIGLLLIIVALFLVLQFTGVLNLLIPDKLAETNMGYGMLFLIGLITSVHCIAMCGGINISQSIRTDKTSRFKKPILYNSGRVISYTIIGGIVGALGSVISFSPIFQGILKLFAGVFMIIMGINMLGIFPLLRMLNIRMPKIFAYKIDDAKEHGKNSFLVGLLNGLMPCGPLQAMQIYALQTGNIYEGAFSMFLFSLGTVPLMLGLGAVTVFFGKKWVNKTMIISAILVVTLGLTMFSQGLTLSGFKILPVKNVSEKNYQKAIIINGVQIVKSKLSSGSYPYITVIAGIPVKWVIDAPKESINGCNNSMNIPEYKTEYAFKPGENII
ncbi:MAG: sulfite exporter TauE/SafE family protein, partial [Clostridiales Family XIII bacterium]|nr:sulfite exporter TauE/SafE family protein [Clostridiales Family XIII bacterium]